jgi:hypothetical protein
MVVFDKCEVSLKLLKKKSKDPIDSVVLVPKWLM